MKVFNPTRAPLSGTNLIEASAGTGKTYMITWLFLRLLLEANIPADQILVVTFTKAATEELKARIHSKLIAAKSAFSKGSCGDDMLIDSLVKHHPHPSLAVHIIQDTLVDFDHVSIFTIHGFCQRILHENAFETLTLFDTELVANPFGFISEVVDDFWRQYLYPLPPELISYILSRVSGPEYFLKLALKKTSPVIKVIPELDEPVIEGLDEYRAVFEKLKKAWSSSRRKVASANGGLKEESLSGTVYGSLKPLRGHRNVSKRDMVVLSLVEDMDKFVDSKSIGFPLFKNFAKFTASKLLASTKKNKTVPTHYFFDICNELYLISNAIEAKMEGYLLYLRTQLYKFLEANLAVKKKSENVQFFDDLLLKVQRALDGSGGDALIAAMRQKYKAALVDEFQDTDTLQYDIFTQLFTSRQNILFMIGDPKQAIYGFRGADIFSYMKASDHADAKYTLLENWRSTPGLISAVNTIFSSAHRPFVFDRIRFDKGVPGTKTTSIGKQNDAAMVLWFLETENNASRAKPMSKSAAVPLIAAAVAGEISRLIGPDNPCQLERVARGIEAGDIAVLVRTNRQAQIIQQHLARRRIPSVLYHTGNIFHTHEAREMERILLSVSEPGNVRRFRAALVTDALGVSGRELDLDATEAGWWESRSQDFQKYYRLWNKHGFASMFRQLMTKESIRQRLLSLPDGERRLTNVLHLMEILHNESTENKKGMTALLKWLSEQRQAQTPESESHLLRLESDDDAVKIITMHRSKGLEFPIVFCPFAWQGSLLQDDAIVFHNASDNEALTLDLGSNEMQRHVNCAQNEHLAENLRLLYVAITRAIERCYLVWGRINTAETSAPAYLFHYQSTADNDLEKEDLLASLKQTLLHKTDKDIWNDLQHLAKRSGGSVDILPMPATGSIEANDAASTAEKEENLSCRQFSGKIETDWKISSYSYMVSKKRPTDEFPDRDQQNYDDGFTLEPFTDLNEKTDIFSFPKGVRAGIFFHDLFEHLDFTAKDPEHKELLIENKLKTYGFDNQWQKPVSSMVNKVLCQVIDKVDDATLTLASIGCQDRINELEFYFPLNPVSPQQLAETFYAYSGKDIFGFPEQIEALTFPVSRGFMKGYIDLVFRFKDRYYLVDWKSNLLGTHVEDFNREALNRIMRREYYFLQYHLYILALDQYLRLRVSDYRYETDFGGVIYMFVRGIDPYQGQEFGIYKDLPAPKLIHALGKTLIPGYEELAVGARV